MSHVLQSIVHSGCGNVHVGGERGDSQHYDPLLKLYNDCLVMISEHRDVQSSMANGSMCIFKGLKLKDPQKTMEYITIDGYYVNYDKVDDIEYIKVELQEHMKKKRTRRNKENNTTNRVFTKSKNIYT